MCPAEWCVFRSPTTDVISLLTLLFMLLLLLLLLGRPSLKAYRLSRFKPNHDKILHDCSSSRPKYTNPLTELDF